MTEERTAIMVIDDDNAFRQLVVNLLRTKKYRVVEARSAEEANAIFSPRDIALAIVDYRLQGTDGMAWITQMREAGRNMPVIFVSGTECDQKTFNWLRNILRVSLIVKKPIIPAVFLEQVEFVLPNNVKVLLTEGEGVSNKKDSIDDAFDSDSPLTSTGLVRQLMQIHTKLEVKTAIEVAQANYAQTAREDWNELMRLLPLVQENPQDGKLFIDTNNLAHKLKGTAGSLGLPEISEAAARIEDFLQDLEPVKSAEQDEQYNKLEPYVESGQKAVETNLSEHANLKLENIPKPRLLLVTANDAIAAAASARYDVTIDVSSSLVGARNRLQRSSYDGAIIDLNLANKESAFILCEEIRLNAADSLPLGLILPDNAVIAPTQAELSFAGISVTMSSQEAVDELEVAGNILLEARRDQKPRILAVDDDPVLTGYLNTVLSAYGMETRTVNSPVETMSTIDTFNPDLVLLDVNMPALTGYEVCRSIRENDRWGNLPVLFLTGKTTPEARSAAYQAGANDFLNKPILTDELLTRVNAQLDKAVRATGRLAKDGVTKLFTEEVLISTGQAIINVSQDIEPVTLTLIKIDNPESVRIVHGSDSLRNVVSSLGAMMLTHFKADDLRGRLGYEHFALISRGQNKHQEAHTIKLLLDTFSNVNFSGLQNNFKATFSAGLADTNEDGGSIYDLLNAANRRLQAGQREQFGSLTVVD